VKNERGFSLIELMVVVAIVGLIAALAIPNLRRARQYAESGSAVQSLRTIVTAQHLYMNKFKKYGTLIDLTPEGTIDTALGLGSRSGYSFVLTLTDDGPLPEQQAKHFSCTAAPESEVARSDFFFVDDTGVIRFKNGAAADVTSDPIPK
jgi:prepilin-type N-terminal cleavage/methylation domain-containing protein